MQTSIIFLTFCYVIHLCDTKMLRPKTTHLWEYTNVPSRFVSNKRQNCILIDG